MFKAKIQSIQDYTDFRDSVSIDVVFYNDEQEFTKNFKLYYSNFKSTEDVQRFIQSECESLDAFYSMVDIIKPLVGLENIVEKMEPVVEAENISKLESVKS